MIILTDLVSCSEDELLIRDRGAIRFVIFNRPAKRNALNLEMRTRFAAALQEAATNAEISAVIVTGAGGCFSAGLDIGELNRSGGRVTFRPHPAEAARAMPKPIIAAVDGPCVTGGLELALSCSFIIASDVARFADTHAKIGAFPAWGQNAFLPGAIGARRARQMSLTGTFVDAHTALAWGLVNEVVPSTELLSRCIALAESIATCSQASVLRQLALINRTEGEALSTALAAEEEESDKWVARMSQHSGDG